MNKYETFSCGQIFHSYPENKTFKEIIDLCNNDEARDSFNETLEDTENEDQQLIICEQYERESWNDICKMIIELAESAERHFKE